MNITNDKPSSVNIDNGIIAKSLMLQDLKDSNIFSEESLEKRSVAEGYYRLAKIYYDKADFKNAEINFVKSVELTEFPRDSYAQLKGYGFLIRIFAETLQEEKMNEYIKKSQSIVDHLETSLGSLSAEYFYYAGMTKNYQGDFDKALELFDLAHQKSHRENEPEMMAKSLYAKGTAFFHLERFDEAIRVIAQLKELLDILKKGYLKGSMHMLLGNIYVQMNELELAMQHYDLATGFLQSKNCWNLYGYILMGKGMALKRKGEYTQAMIFLNQALNISKSNFQQLSLFIRSEIEDVNDSSVDLYLDRHNRLINEKTLGTIDFKHRFVLLEILFLLARNPGKPFDKEELSKLIWKEEYNPLIHDKLIYTSISRLRKLIEPKGSGRKYIIRGKDGYNFNPRVKARFHKEASSQQKRFMGNIELSSPV